MMKTCFATALLVLVAATAAKADVVYPNAGTENPTTYTFTATTNGSLVAHFYSSGASFSETLGLLVNGKDRGTAVDNHNTAFGEMYNFDNVSVGDSLIFYIHVKTTGHTYYSDFGMNKDGVNHVCSTAFAGDGKTSAGTYVGFEDLSLHQTGWTDNNYTGEQFVFTVAAVPEPFTCAMMVLGFAGVGFLCISRQEFGSDRRIIAASNSDLKAALGLFVSAPELRFGSGLTTDASKAESWG
ncbi:hypothetical protein JJE66_29160 [Bradyrhizobium diazoefficiens]|nr:hypothetical protein [Bradyrhizobium diazoefficiens]MBK3665290.1 hypothetical protein [Bradyrhizobium diazoefficiens]